MTDLDRATMTRDEADARLARVRSAVVAAWDDLIELYLGRAWVAKGYDSWGQMCEAELDGARITLPRDERGEVVRRMAASGMSTRAIGTAVGVHHDTVAEDIKRAPVGNPTPVPAPRHVDTSTGEITETARPDETAALLAMAAVDDDAAAALVDARDEGDVSPENVAERPVTGLDGKTYTRPAPRPVEVPAEYTAPTASYMTNFWKAVTTASKVMAFDAERVGREATEVEWQSVLDLRRFAEFVDRAERARRGLRVIKGAAR